MIYTVESKVSVLLSSDRCFDDEDEFISDCITYFETENVESQLYRTENAHMYPSAIKQELNTLIEYWCDPETKKQQIAIMEDEIFHRCNGIIDDYWFDTYMNDREGNVYIAMHVRINDVDEQVDEEDILGEINSTFDYMTSHYSQWAHAHDSEMAVFVCLGEDEENNKCYRDSDLEEYFGEDEEVQDDCN